MPVQLMPPREVFDSVVSLETEEHKVATGFRVRRGDRCFLLTAKHAMPDSRRASLRTRTMDDPGAAVLELERLDGEHEADVAVFGVPFTGRALDISRVGDDGLYVAQEVLALGFPGGERYNVPMPQGFLALPLVKKGIVSAFAAADRPMYLDLIANLGFSGGPVIFAPAQGGPVRVCGMISQTATMPVPSDDANARALLTAAGISTAASSVELLQLLHSL